MDENIPVVPPVPAQPVSPQPQPAAPVPVVPPQPTMQVEPIAPQIPKSKSKFLLILLVVLVLVALGLAGVFAYRKYISNPTASPTTQPTPISSPTPTPAPTPDVTANWKTYTNTAYNYLVKYPLDWEIAVKGDADASTFDAPYLESPCNYDSGQLCSQMQIETGTYDPNKKFEPNFIINLTGSKPDKISNTTSTTVGGEEAQGFEYFQSNYGDSGRLLYVIVTNHKNTKYVFTYVESQKNRTFQTGVDWQNKKIFNQILSTFQFTQ